MPSVNFRSNLRIDGFMHDEPLRRDAALPVIDAAAPGTAVCTASSRFALGITINGSLPPNSSTVFLICFPHWLATSHPAGSLPVSVAATTRLSSSTRATCDDPIRSVRNSPFEKPARHKISSIASADCGTFDACFNNPGYFQPLARARQIGILAKTENSKA